MVASAEQSAAILPLDAHCHAHLGASLAGNDRVGGALINATSEQDWDAVLNFCSSGLDRSIFYPALGVHPWHVGNAASGWVDRLRAHVKHSSMSIGECGLDRSRRAEVPMTEQVAALKAQLQIGVEFSRTVSLHCVQAWGKLADILDEEWNRNVPVILHSAACSTEMVRRFAELGALFSVSFRTSDELVQAIPSGRLLLETDYPFGPIGEQTWSEALTDCAARVARLREASQDDIIAVSNNNLRKALNLPTESPSTAGGERG